jgi:hypothetical protein
MPKKLSSLRVLCASAVNNTFNKRNRATDFPTLDVLQVLGHHVWVASCLVRVACRVVRMVWYAYG